MNNIIIYRHYLTNSDCYKRGIKQTPKGIQVHSTGCNNPYLRRYVQPDDGRLGTSTNHHNKSGIDVCASAYIGKLANGTPAIYQTLPWNYRCWLSGRGNNGNANQLGYIGFEICEDNLQNKDYFEAVVMGLSVKLVAYLCNTFNIPLSNVHDHKELHSMGLASNHADIQHWLKKYGLTMDDYRAAVKQAMEEGVAVTYIEEDEPKEEVKVMYQAKVTAGNSYPVKMRKSASTSSAVVMSVPQGSIVNVYANPNADWSQIEYEGNNGFMMSKFLTKVEEPAAPPTIPDAPTTNIAVTRDGLQAIRNNLAAAIALIDKLLINT